MIDIHFNEFETGREIDKLIENVANRVIDCIYENADDGGIDSDDVWRMVERESEETIGNNIAHALHVVAAYGLWGALNGDVDYEDSPIHQFEDDVYRNVELRLDDVVINF